MASENENSDMGLGELEEFEVTEIDEALLRELLEEEHDGGDVESVENGRKMMENEQEQQKQKQKIHCSEQHEGCNVQEFEWVNNVMEIEPPSLNDALQNWYVDDMVGMMVDFGYTNIGECCSQIYEGFVSNDASYGCLWEDL